MKNRKILAILLAVIITFYIVAVTIAQADARPPREVERTAPERETIILSQDENSTILQLPPIADAYIASERPNQNFGSDALFLGYNLPGTDNFGAERILLRFDIASNIPPNSVVQSAVLRLRLSFSSPTNDTPMGTVLRRLASPWSEFGVTWNNEPTWTPIDDTTQVGSTLDWYEWEMTDVVQAWYEDAYPNDGIEIIGDETVQQRERAFYSRETNTQFFPQLVIEYADISDIEPPIITVEPLPPYSPRQFTVQWSGMDVGEAGIQYYDVQLRIDGAEWQDWLTEVTTTTAEFAQGENGHFYEFRARGVDNNGNVELYGDAEASTTVDTLPPETAVSPLPTITDQNVINVTWGGTDSGAGIRYYDVQIRLNDGPWQLWIPQTLATSAQYNAPTDGYYAFEVRAVDELGFVEAFANQAEAAVVVDSVAPFVTPQLWLPTAINS